MDIITATARTADIEPGDYLISNQPEWLMISKVTTARPDEDGITLKLDITTAYCDGTVLVERDLRWGCDPDHRVEVLRLVPTSDEFAAEAESWQQYRFEVRWAGYEGSYEEWLLDDSE